MVGLVNLGLINSFNLEKSEQSIELPRSLTKMTQVGQPSLFSKALEREEEIQGEAQKIKEVLSEGYNYQTKTVKKIEPLIRGLLQTNDFISSYWDYFTPEKKVELIVNANYLEKVTNPDYYNSYKNVLRLIFTKEFFTIIKLILKYFTNILANPKNHIFIQFNRTNQMVAKLILTKAKEDFTKLQLTNELKLYWQEQEGHFQKTSTPEEWSRELDRWTIEHGRSGVNLSDWAVSRESMYEDEDRY
jgi:hypothetical protein